MKAEFICHPDFENEKPIYVFRRLRDGAYPRETDPKFLNRHILFRKKASFPKLGAARLKITADDYYKLYVNGVFVTQGPAPSYPNNYNYNEVDITPYIKEGENCFAVHTYYQGLCNNAWVSRDRRASLWFSLSIDGETVLVSDESWKYHDHTGYTECGRVGYDTAFLEAFDSRAPEAEFFRSDFDDSEWDYAKIYKNADYKLVPQRSEQLDVYQMPPSEVKRIDGGLFIDFGRETVGHLSLVAKGKEGDTVIVRCAEELTEDGRARYKMRCNCTYDESWTLSGKTDSMTQYDFKAFRYVELLFPESTEILDVKMTVRHYPYEERATYKTENENLSRIIRLCLDTVKYGSQENYMDCPTREKAQYLGDVSVAGRTQAVATGDTTLIKKSVIDFCNTSFICDGIMAISCSSAPHEITDYSLQLPAQVAWIYAMDKDKSFVAEVEPYLTRLYRHFLEFENSEGLLESVTESWNLVDWPENLRDGYDFRLNVPVEPGVHNVLNAFWCGFLDAMDEIYSILGMEKTGRAESAKRAFISAFYSEKLGLFADSKKHTHAAVHSNLLPLLFDIGVSENTELRDRIIALIEKKGLGAMGVYMAYFALAALVRCGRRDLAEKLATAPDAWMNMLSEGATTTFEAWGKDQKKNSSLFHPWATAPLIIFAEGVRIY